MIDGSHPLWHAWLKWHWAKRHLAAVQNEAVRYKEGHLHAAGLEVDGEWRDSNELRLIPGQSHEMVILFNRVTQPHHAALKFGDMIANLRSCLDYIAWEISHKSGRGSNIYFPILEQNPYTTPAGTSYRYEAVKDWQKKTALMNAQARWLVMEVQPYRAKHGRGQRLLSDLKTLVNSDKHRTLTSVVVDLPPAQSGSISIFRDDGTALSHEEANTYRIVRPHQVGRGQISHSVHNTAPTPVTVRFETESAGRNEIVVKDRLSGTVEIDKKALEIFNAVTVVLDTFIERWEDVRPQGKIGGKLTRVAKRHQETPR